MKSDVSDTLMRVAAFTHVLKLTETQNNISAEDLRRGFTFEGERIPLVNPQRGIFKPRQMQYLLSIRTGTRYGPKSMGYDSSGTAGLLCLKNCAILFTAARPLPIPV